LTRVLHVQKVAGIAGSERHLLTLLPRLDRARFRPVMVALESPGGGAADFAAAMRAAGVDTHVLPIRADADPRCLLHLRREIVSGRYGIVHTHLVHGDMYGTAAAATCRPRPIVVSSKHGYENYERTSLWYRLGALLGYGVDAIVTISDALQAKVADAERLPRSKMHTIHYGLDVPAHVPQRAPSMPVNLIAVGRLVPVKGFRFLLEAMARVPASASVHLTIVGDGPERASLEALAAELRVASRVTFAGWRQDVGAMLDRAAIFVLPTLGEGFGLAVLEAMGHELPVIASDTMSLPEIVHEGVTGLLVPPKDPAALARAITLLASDPEMRRAFGQAGRRRAAEMFSIDSMVTRTERLYQSLLEGRR
jgi:glycosyltransferase involved in cell wall biosynthesis